MAAEKQLNGERDRLEHQEIKRKSLITSVRGRLAIALLVVPAVVLGYDEIKSSSSSQESVTTHKATLSDIFREIFSSNWSENKALHHTPDRSIGGFKTSADAAKSLPGFLNEVGQKLSGIKVPNDFDNAYHEEAKKMRLGSKKTMNIHLYNPSSGHPPSGGTVVLTDPNQQSLLAPGYTSAGQVTVTGTRAPTEKELQEEKASVAGAKELSQKAAVFEAVLQEKRRKDESQEHVFNEINKGAGSQRQYEADKKARTEKEKASLGVERTQAALEAKATYEKAVNDLLEKMEKAKKDPLDKPASIPEKAMEIAKSPLGIIESAPKATTPPSGISRGGEVSPEGGVSRGFDMSIGKEASTGGAPK